MRQIKLIASHCYLVFFILIFYVSKWDYDYGKYIIINFIGIITYIGIYLYLILKEKKDNYYYHQKIFLIFFPLYYLFVIYNFIFQRGKTLLGENIYFPQKDYLYFSLIFNIVLIMFMIGSDILKYSTNIPYKNKRSTSYSFIIIGFGYLVLFFINIKMMDLTFIEFIGDRMIQNHKSVVSLGGLTTTGIYSVFSYYLWKNYCDLKSWQKKIFWLLYILWCSINLLRGERRLFLIFIILTGLIYNIRIIKISKKKLISIIIPLYFILVFLGIFRHYNHLEFHKVYTNIKRDISIDTFIFSNNDEFNYPAQSFFYIYAHEKNNLKLGKTYIDAFLINMPRIIVKEKPSRPSNLYMRNYHYDSMLIGRGYAYSCVTEAFQNFGFFSPFIVFFFLGIIFSLIRKNSINNSNLLYIYLFLNAELINFMRIDFATFLSEILYFIIPTTLISCLNLILREQKDGV